MIAPKLISAKAISQNEIELAWENQNQNVLIQTIIEIKPYADDHFRQVKTLDQNETQFLLKDLEPLTKYDFRIRFVFPESNDFEISNEVSETTLEHSIEPNFPKPTIVALNLAFGEIGIHYLWSNNDLSLIDFFSFQRRQPNQSTWTLHGTVFNTSNIYSTKNFPPGRLIHRMIVNYKDGSQYITGPSEVIVGKLEEISSVKANHTTTGAGNKKHHITWDSMLQTYTDRYEVTVWGSGVTYQNLTIPGTAFEFDHLPDTCPSGNTVYYGIQAFAKNTLIVPSDLTTVKITCP